MKRIIQVVLLGFVVVSLAYAFWGKQSAEVDAEEKVAKEDIPVETAVSSGVSVSPQQAVCSAGEESKVVAYYFHGDRRCFTCQKLEEYSQEAINSAFSDELSQGKLEWHTVNIDKPENQHFAKDYNLYASTLLLSKIECGKEINWKNLEQVWRLVRDKTKFLQFVQSEVRGLLG